MAIGAVALTPGLLPDSATPEPQLPIATGTTSPMTQRAIAERQKVELSDGVLFSYEGASWEWQTPTANGEVSQATYDGIEWGPRQVRVEYLPGDKLHSMDVFRGDAVRVVYTVRIPGRPTATYEADVYRISAHAGWRLSYAIYPAHGVTDALRVEVSAVGYDAAGKPIPVRPQK